MATMTHRQRKTFEVFSILCTLFGIGFGIVYAKWYAPPEQRIGFSPPRPAPSAPDAGPQKLPHFNGILLHCNGAGLPETIESGADFHCAAGTDNSWLVCPATEAKCLVEFGSINRQAYTVPGGPVWPVVGGHIYHLKAVVPLGTP